MNVEPQAIQKLIEDGILSGREVYLRQISAKIGWHHNQWLSFFKEQTGYTPVYYARLFRHRCVCMLLRTSDRPLRQIADFFDRAEGFLHRDFKEIVGVRPGEFRKMSVEQAELTMAKAFEHVKFIHQFRDVE